MSIYFDIPDEYVSSLTLLSSIDEKTFNEINSLIDNSPIVFYPGKIAKPIGKYSLKEVKSIIMAMTTLFISRERKEISNEEIADGICKNLKEKKNVELDKQQEQILKDRLINFLKNEKLYISSKPIDILREFENIYLESRITTDIRPIFGTDITKRPQATVIIHNLHIHFRHGDEGDNHKDIFFTLDNDDLDELKSIIERAEKKNQTLIKMLESNGITNLDNK